MERRALLALISLIRDREPDREKWPATGIPLRLLYERLYVPQPGKPAELQRKYQRQAIRRALGRLHPHYITALALGWVNVEDGTLVRWQGGGRRRQSGDGCTLDRPNWKLVGLTRVGIKRAELLERPPESGDLPATPAGRRRVQKARNSRSGSASRRRRSARGPGSTAAVSWTRRARASSSTSAAMRSMTAATRARSTATTARSGQSAAGRKLTAGG